MPRGNGTGPSGMGSKTGRAMGFCTGNKVAGFANPNTLGRGLGRGNGVGRGIGGGRRNFQNDVTMSSENELDTLKNKISLLEKELNKTKSKK